MACIKGETAWTSNGFKLNVTQNCLLKEFNKLFASPFPYKVWKSLSGITLKIAPTSKGIGSLNANLEVIGIIQLSSLTSCLTFLYSSSSPTNA